MGFGTWMAVGLVALSVLGLGALAVSSAPATPMGADASGHPTADTNGVPPGPPSWLNDSAPYGPPSWIGSDGGPPDWLSLPTP